MEPSPAHVIRTIRKALKMSQSEFAKALGWAPSTISRWERGDAVPTRLALKTILAFAEERKVRYRPKAPTQALVPLAPGHSRQSNHEPLQPPVALPPCDSATEVDPFFSLTARRPRWAAEARFRFAVDSRPYGYRQPLRTTLRNAGILAASFGVVLAIGLRGPGIDGQPTSTPPAGIAALPSALPAPAPAVQTAALSAAEIESREADTAAAEALESAEAAAAPASIARLESIVMIGHTGRATFRTHADAVTVTEGSWLGDRQVSRITGDRVELVDTTGTSRLVRLGDPLPPG
jgi:transcriptional regulator with XRE-family HTH domain